MDAHLSIEGNTIGYALRIPLRDLSYISLVHALSCDN